jgi:hypothetical protein
MDFSNLTTLGNRSERIIVISHGGQPFALRGFEHVDAVQQGNVVSVRVGTNRAEYSGARILGTMETRDSSGLLLHLGKDTVPQFLKRMGFAPGPEIGGMMHWVEKTPRGQSLMYTKTHGPSRD